MNGVVTKLQGLKFLEVTELGWQDAMEAILRKVEAPHVCDVAQSRGDGAEKVELGEVQRHHTATAASS